MPLPCRSAIFSSRVIWFSTIPARSSGERLEFIQGWFAFCAMREPQPPSKPLFLQVLRLPKSEVVLAFEPAYLSWFAQLFSNYLICLRTNF